MLVGLHGVYRAAYAYLHLYDYISGNVNFSSLPKMHNMGTLIIAQRYVSIILYHTYMHIVIGYMTRYITKQSNHSPTG